MNRLIIIGNGFDLAHELKTSYRDFINDFWEQEKAKVPSTYLHSLFDSNNVVKYGYQCDILEIHSESPFALKSITNEYGYAWFKQVKTIYHTTLSIKNAFLKTISDAMYQNWVDIEEAYYNELTSCLENKRKGETVSISV